MIRLGQASAVIDAQDVITDLAHRSHRSAAPDHVDECFVPAPAPTMQHSFPGPSRPATAPRR